MSGFKRYLTDQGVDPAKLGTYLKYKINLWLTISLSEQNKLFQADQNLCDIRPLILVQAAVFHELLGISLLFGAWGICYRAQPSHFFFQSKTGRGLPGIVLHSTFRHFQTDWAWNIRKLPIANYSLRVKPSLMCFRLPFVQTLVVLQSCVHMYMWLLLVYKSAPQRHRSAKDSEKQ